MYKTGIDVSKWQGTIDWEKVKAAGVEFAMLRAGYGRGNLDEQFERNASECTRLGILFGAYWFSYAYTPDMARNEALHCMEALREYKLSYPVAYDFEYDSVDYASEQGVQVTKTLASSMARAFCEEVKSGGYYPMVYANPNYLAAYFDADIPKEYDVWVAEEPRAGDRTRAVGGHVAVQLKRLGGRDIRSRRHERGLQGLSRADSRRR